MHTSVFHALLGLANICYLRHSHMGALELQSAKNSSNERLG